ncbi:MAG TPA: AarF/ABC1/UbiB kinase family protein [Microthrixaceae bacterium]|nr:AarF/ABC1/UbiB kinase family protein [Microthrixaceae bacterium]
MTVAGPEAAGSVELPLIERIDLGLDGVERGAKWRRAGRVAWVLGRRLGPVPIVWLAEGRRRALRDLLGAPLEAAAFDLGVTFVKLGQLLASSPSLAGEVLADAMRGVLDQGPAVPYDEVRTIIEADLDRPFEEVFAEFEARPFAAASLAVVHRARLVDGTPVAVKVLRPDSATSVSVDLGMVSGFSRWLARQVPLGGTRMLPQTMDGLAEQLSEELDLRNEMRVMEWFGRMIEEIGAVGVSVPHAFDHASGRRVLTMEFIDGFPVDDLGSIATHDVDASRAIESLIEAWFALALCTGVFHGDMHAGNLMLTRDGGVVLLDWGIVGRLPEASRRFFRRSLEGALGDESAWIDVRDHMLNTFGDDMMDQLGISPEQFLELLKYQTTLIMTMPFDELDLMMLMAPATGTAPVTGSATVPDAETPAPSTPIEWWRAVRAERRRVRELDPSTAPPPPSRGELLLIKQLVFFERYGKMFLGDRPLIYDAEVYRSLLAMPVHAASHG